MIIDARVAGGQDACKTVSPSSVCNNITATCAPATTTPGGGDANDSKCVLSLPNNSVSATATSGLLLKEVDV